MVSLIVILEKEFEACDERIHLLICTTLTESFFSSKQLTEPEEICKLEGHPDITLFGTVNFFSGDTSLPPPACFDSKGHVEDTEGHPEGSED